MTHPATGHKAALLTSFAHGDLVHIDGDNSIVATVTAILWRSTVTQVEVSWVHCGDIKTFWLEEWRLKRIEPN